MVSNRFEASTEGEKVLQRVRIAASRFTTFLRLKHNLKTTSPHYIQMVALSVLSCFSQINNIITHTDDK